MAAFVRVPFLWRRLAYGAGAVVLADLIIGMVAFSAITLGSLWMFSVGWIYLAQESAARGLGFGSSGQLALAWAGAFVALPLLIGTVYLGGRAFRLPRDLAGAVRQPV